MRHLIAAIKFSAFFCIILAFFVHHFLMYLIGWSEESRLESISSYCSFGLRILNVRVSELGVKADIHGRMIVSNHLSYLDVLVYFSRYPSLFITSNEIKETFLLGDICKLAGCFFIERRGRLRTQENKEKEILNISQKLQNGFNVFLFPEGTSSSGEKVLPFRGNFFQVAIDSATPIVPITLKYQGESAKKVPWYGKMTFADHLFSLCMEKQINVSINVHDEVIGSEKLELANLTHQLISEAYA